MTALNLSFARIKDPKLFEDYVQRASVIMKDYGVEVVGRGTFASAMAGDGADATLGAVFRYASLEVADAFFASERYKALIPLRDRACDMTILIFDEGEAAQEKGRDQ